MAAVTARDEALEREADAFRSSGALGRPGPLSRLFEYLLSRSYGPAPKEIEIAVEVFGKRPDFDVAQDSLVRVYVHKLRRRLDEFYARNARPARLAIPKGEYRLVLEPASGAQPEIRPRPDAQAVRRPAWRATALVAAAALLVGAFLAWLWFNTLGLSAGERRLAQLRASALWAPLFADDAPITIVVGDYYLLGETDESGDVRRLVREFFINSPADFIDHLELDPERMKRYRNLDLTYLPIAAAYALHELTPLLAAKERVRVMLMSDLDGNALASSHIVYVGYLSGLGMLGDPVFDASRLELGGTFDELVDPQTKRTYVARQPGAPGGAYTDYGYFATAQGPTGKRIVIVAGTRDLGVIETARAITTPLTAGQIAKEAGGAASFESLFEVYGVAKASMRAERLFVSKISAERLRAWH